MEIYGGVRGGKRKNWLNVWAISVFLHGWMNKKQCNSCSMSGARCKQWSRSCGVSIYQGPTFINEYCQAAIQIWLIKTEVGVMICLGQGGLCSPGASSSVLIQFVSYCPLWREKDVYFSYLWVSLLPSFLIHHEIPRTTEFTKTESFTVSLIMWTQSIRTPKSKLYHSVEHLHTQPPLSLKGIFVCDISLFGEWHSKSMIPHWKGISSLRRHVILHYLFSRLSLWVCVEFNTKLWIFCSSYHGNQQLQHTSPVWWRIQEGGESQCA